MKLENLKSLKTKKAKRVGRGPGSGKGKTAGRGTKGQNARNKLSITHPHFEGGQRPLIKRLPYKRGKGNKSVSKKPIAINLKTLNLLPKNSQVNLETLVKAGIVRKNDAASYGVQILGDGDLKIALNVTLPISKSAAKKIEKAGGKVLSQTKNKEVTSKTKITKKSTTKAKN